LRHCQNKGWTPVHGLSSLKRQCYRPLGYPVLFRYCELDNRSHKDRKNYISLSLHWFTAERERHVLDTSGKFVDNELAQIESVKVLPIDSQLNEECLEKLPPNSFVIVDDFQLLTKTSQWQRVINYCAHHFHLSIFLVVHSHQNTEGLHYALKNACNIYLTYSNNSKYFLKSLAHGKYFNFFCKHWREGIQNKHICFINTYQSVIISYIDKLLFKELQSPVEMSDMTDMDSNTLGDIEEKRWIITNLSENQTKDTVSDEHDLEGHFYKELTVSYSKQQFPKMFKITRCLLKKAF